MIDSKIIMRYIVLAMIAAIFLFFKGISHAQNLEYVGSTLWRGANDVEIIGSKAYCAGNNGLVILNILNPASPTFVSQCYSYGKGRRIDVSGNYAFMAGGPGGVQIFDISDSLNPRIVGHYELSGSTNDICISGNYAYIANDSTGLQIINIESPTNPIYAGNYPLTSANAISIAGNYAYVGTFSQDSSGTMQILDIINPSQPILIGSIDVSWGINCIFVAYENAFVTTVGQFLILDVGDPSNPQIISTAEIDNGNGLKIVDLYAFLVTDSRLDIFDISNPVFPTNISDYGNVYGFTGIFVSNSYAYLTLSRGLKVIDISDLLRPTLIGAFEVSYSVFDAAPLGNYAFVADGWNRELEVIDVSNLSDPMPIAHCFLPGDAFGICISGSYAHMADDESGMQIIDISNPDSPAIIGNYAYMINRRVEDIQVVDNYAYLADLDNGLLIVNVQNPSGPTLSGRYHTVPNSIFVSGHYAFIAEMGDGQTANMSIIDVTNPANPILSGHLNLQSPSLYGVTVSGDYAYLGGEGRIFLINITNPSSPVLAGTCNFMGNENALDIKIRGNYAYVANGSCGVMIVDISDPVNPALVSNYYLPGTARNIIFYNDICYVADNCSMMILRSTPTDIHGAPSLPYSSSFPQNYPNPFNAQTTISYSLPAPGHVVPDVYDIIGRKVANLMDAEQNAGEYNIIWNAADLPSGIYFARLQAGEHAENIRMVLLK